MVSMRDFLSGIIAGILSTFIGPYITGFIVGFLPSIPFLGFIINILFFGVWVLVATLILEKTGH